MFHLAEEWGRVERALPNVKMLPGEKHRCACPIRTLHPPAYLLLGIPQKLRLRGHARINAKYLKGFALGGAPEVIRTPDLLVRSQTLYPAELRALGSVLVLI
jgi:hypothetical protein